MFCIYTADKSVTNPIIIISSGARYLGVILTSSTKRIKCISKFSADDLECFSNLHSCYGFSFLKLWYCFWHYLQELSVMCDNDAIWIDNTITLMWWLIKTSWFSEYIHWLWSCGYWDKFSESSLHYWKHGPDWVWCMLNVLAEGRWHSHVHVTPHPKTSNKSVIGVPDRSKTIRHRQIRLWSFGLLICGQGF